MTAEKACNNISITTRPLESIIFLKAVLVFILLYKISCTIVTLIIIAVSRITCSSLTLHYIHDVS